MKQKPDFRVGFLLEDNLSIGGSKVTKDTEESIVEMLCEGARVSTILKELGIRPHELEKRLNRVRFQAGLPWDKRTYKARKEDILFNLQLYLEYQQKWQELRDDYRSRLIKFDF